VLGQRGATNVTAANFLQANTTEPPLWDTPGNILYEYQLALNGDCTIKINTQSAGLCTNGGGANQVHLAIPYDWVANIKSSVNLAWPGTLFYNATGGSGNRIGGFTLVDGANDHMRMLKDVGTTLDNDDFSTNSDDINGIVLTYSAFEI